MHRYLRRLLSYISLIASPSFWTTRKSLVSVAISSAAFWVWGIHSQSAWGRVKGRTAGICMRDRWENCARIVAAIVQ